MKTTVTSDDPEWFNVLQPGPPPVVFPTPLWARLALLLIRAAYWVTLTVGHALTAIITVALLAFLVFHL